MATSESPDQSNIFQISNKRQPSSKNLKTSFKAEKKSAELQVDRIEKELQTSHEQNILLTSKLHKCEREVNSLTAQVSTFMVS